MAWPASQQRGPLINAAAVGGSNGMSQDALRPRRQIAGRWRGAARKRFYQQPTVITDVSPQAALFCEETFGPLAGIVKFDTEARAIQLANDTSAGLASYF